MSEPISEAGLLGSDEARRIASQSLKASEAVSKAGVLKVLADPNRLRLLSFLNGEVEMICVSDLASMAGLDISSTSHHLRKAKAVGLAESRRYDKHAMYRLTDKGRSWIGLMTGPADS